MSRNSTRRLFLGIAAFAASLAGMSVSGSAHHSTAMFDWGNEVALQNMTVERWVWTNPHTFIYARDASNRRWAFEGMTPNTLTRFGWTRRSLQPGDVVTIYYYPLRDGRPGGFNVRVAMADGTELRQLPAR